MAVRRRVAVPSEPGDGLAAARSEHVGRAPAFTLVEVSEDGSLGAVHVLQNRSAEGGHAGVATLLVGEAVTDLVVAGIGEPMRARLVPAGVSIWHDGRSATVGDAVRSLVNGTLLPLGDADVHPAGHGHSPGSPASLN